MPKDITEGIGGSQGPFVGLPRRLLHSCSAPTGSCLDNSPLPPNTFALDYHRRVLVFFFFFETGNRVSLCNPAWPGTCYTDLHRCLRTHRDLPVSASRVPGLKGCSYHPQPLKGELLCFGFKKNKPSCPERASQSSGSQRLAPGAT